jgi:aspartate kinase
VSHPGSYSGDVRPLVLKFGGTSLGSPARMRLAARRVQAHVAAGRSVVAVVSAMGHRTDGILRWVHALCPAPRGERWARETDRALATGETLSASLLAAALCARGVRAVALSGGEAGVHVDGAFGGGRIAEVRPGRVRALLADGVVPVVAGFQGVRRDGETVVLDRGGSDVSAVALAAALGCAPCHIVTDVDAVYSGDPRTDGSARPFRELTHRELLALAEGGAQVVHPTAARLAHERNVPLRVYGFRAPPGGAGGTRIRTPGLAAAPVP